MFLKKMTNKNKKMTKKQICDAAVGMYLDNPSRFSLSAVANQLEIPRSQIYQNFPTKNAVLRFFYQDCFEQYFENGVCCKTPMKINTAASPPKVAAHFAAHRFVSFSVHPLFEPQREPYRGNRC